MLKHLYINNYALIDELSISFQSGFSVITGETGSGKSIILGALSMLTGDRADVKSLRNQENKCVIEGTFSIPNHVEFNTFFTENDLDYSEVTIIRREINPQGKSRSFINDTPVTLQAIKLLGEKLIDIHSQHENAVLNDRVFLYKIIDEHAQSFSELKSYQVVFEQLKKQQDELKKLLEKEVKAQHEKDYTQFLLSEFEGISIEKCINDDVEAEYATLANAEEIKNLSSEVISVLDDNAFSASSQLNTALLALQKLAKLSPAFDELQHRISICVIEVKEATSDLSRKVSSIEIDNRKLLQLEELIGSLNKLIKKHNVRNAEELLTKKSNLEASLQNINSLSESIDNIKKEIVTLSKEVLEKGTVLRNKRKAMFGSIETNINAMLAKMNMKNAHIQFSQTPFENPNLLGLDDITILVRTNLGSAFEPLKKIASGGELSRVMLAIKSLQSQNNAIPTLIFDEIDTGVSGEVANAMGQIMQQLSAEMQVVSITHLPQIASKGSQHFKVYKEEKNNITHTHLIALNNDQRVLEIAEMISGKNPSETAIANAKELLSEMV